MSGYPEKLLTSGVWILTVLWLALGLAEPGFAARPEQNPGVIIPDAEKIYSGVSTEVRETAEGAIWRISLPHPQAWQVLKRSLQRLGIGFTETDDEAPTLLTDWVVWEYDATANTGHSKPPHLGSQGTTERHRFRFELVNDGADSPTEFRISDAARQKQVDIAPDSEYLWMEWRDFPLQAGAAFTFGRRLQGDYEVVMSLQSVTVLPRPATKPPTSGPGAAVTAQPAAGQQAAGKAAISLPVVPPPPVRTPAASVPVQTEPPTTTGPRPAPVTATGLLVDSPVDAVWSALLLALEDLKVDIETADKSQLMVVTGWVYANYDKKSQQLRIHSDDDSGWAFDWRGSGPQRHRFQLVLIGTGNGDKTLVRAYHIGFQEQIDQTPDSSQTLLAWENHKTDPRVAAAFLRRLRIIVNH